VAYLEFVTSMNSTCNVVFVIVGLYKEVHRARGGQNKFCICGSSMLLSKGGMIEWLLVLFY
jgi:hypothetical protein